ncbi:DNA helicase [Tanacetum coccineum]
MQSTVSLTPSIHYEDGNPARAYIKQALGYLKDGDGDGNSQHLRYQLKQRQWWLPAMAILEKSANFKIKNVNGSDKEIGKAVKEKKNKKKKKVKSGGESEIWSCKASFTAFPLSEPTKKAISDMGFQHLTPIQSRAIPPLLEGKDVLYDHLKMEMEMEIPSSSNVKLITECSDTTYTCYEVMKDLIKVSKLPQTLISYSSSQVSLGTFNHAYLCLDRKDCIIRPALITFLNTAQKPEDRGHGPVKYLHINNNLPYSEDDGSSYMDLGNCDQHCRHCGSLFWYNERLKGAEYTRQAEYHLCCGGGQIYMQLSPDPPDFIKQLLTNNHFMEHIRAYNQMFAMTSFGAKVDDSVNKGRGPYVFKISGQIYHWIGSLCPEEGNHSRFLQLYIYDTRNEVRNRMKHFSGVGESAINPEIVQGLIHVLDEHNGLVRLFRTARDRCITGEISAFKIRLYNMSGVRGYELLTADLLRGIVFEDGPISKTYFDVIIEFRGFYPELQLKPRDGRGKGKKVTMNAYYRYQLHPRVKEFGLIFRTDRADVVDSKNEMQDAQQIDNYIFTKIPESVQDPKGYKLVTELMMYGPCGAASSSAACMQEGSCSKQFPKTYNDRMFFDSNGHTHYRRRDTWVHVMKGKSKLDNCDVVPYNRALCLAFEAHINVEYCGWSMLIKYLFKYILKGPDRILAKISNLDESTTATCNRPHIDEIQNYVDGRFICPYKACWRIFDFLIHSREPAIQILNVHQENMQRFTFCKSDRLDIIVNLPKKKKTTLTEWLTYVHPSSGDLFYFCILLCHRKGCKSPIEAPPQHLLRDLQNKLLMQEKNYKHDLLREEAAEKIVLAIALSSIASLLLPAGRIAHSWFKLPLELTGESLCHAKKKSQLGNLLVETNLIIWDEASMNE